MSPMQRKLLTVFVIPVLLGSCQNQTSPHTVADLTSGPTQQFNDWLDAQYKELLDFSPLQKTRLGIKEDYDQLDDVSEASLARQLTWREDSVARMRASFDRDQLSADGQLSWDLWIYLLKDAKAKSQFQRHGYIFGRYGPQGQLPNNLINYHKVDEASDMNAYISRLRQSGTYIRSYLKRTQLAAADGIRAPYFDYDRTLSEIARVTTGAPFTSDGGTSNSKSAIWTDITAKVQSLLDRGRISAAEADEFTS